MGKVLKWLGGIFVVLIIIGIIASGDKSGNTGNDTQSNNTSGKNSPTQSVQQTPTVVDAIALVEEYDKNKIAAQDKYTGKFVQTTGYISNISNDITGNYYLSLKPSNEQYYFGTNITCYYANKSAKSEITTLENGQSVTVQGIMADMSVGIVVMNNCKVVK